MASTSSSSVFGSNVNRFVSSPRTYICHACPGFTTPFMTEFHHHNKLVHKESTVFKCPLCQHVMRSNAQVRDHLSRMEELELASCHICRKNERRTKHDWAEHYKIHKPIIPQRRQPFACPYCSKSFKLRKNMEYHVQKYHRERQSIGVVAQARCSIMARVWRPWEQNNFTVVKIDLR